jgi:hypothetical protein
VQGTKEKKEKKEKKREKDNAETQSYAERRR